MVHMSHNKHLNLNMNVTESGEEASCNLSKSARVTFIEALLKKYGMSDIVADPMGHLIR